MERSRIIDGTSVAPGDAVIGLASSGLHSNGYSLARKVLLDDGTRSTGAPPEGSTGRSADALLEPTRIYVKDVLALLAAVEVKGLAHITGGGLPGNVPRCLPGRHAGGARRASAGRGRRSSTSVQRRARSRATRCSSPSTWAWASSRWWPGRTCRRRLPLLAARLQAYRGGRIEQGQGESHGGRRSA